MILISHRGNISGRNESRENSIEYIHEALAQDFDVEIDIWYVDDEFWLGHDKPQYKIEEHFLENEKLWCHAKNIDALSKMKMNQLIHCFWHQEDDVTLTSKGYMWTYPGKHLAHNSIAVLPELNNDNSITMLPKISGICSDYIENYTRVQGIIIQGPTTYCREVVKAYKGIPNVVWSTWSNEPVENIEAIKAANIDVVQSSLPKSAGYGNVNYQVKSSYEGVKYLKAKGVEEGLKIRGDIKPTKIAKLLKILKGRDLSFLAICKPNVRPLFYELGYTHTSFDFPSDQLLYGTLDNLDKCYNFQTQNADLIPAEALIIYNFLTHSNLAFDLKFRTLQKYGITFFAQDCLDNNIKLNFCHDKYLEHYKSATPNLLDHAGDKSLHEY